MSELNCTIEMIYTLRHRN